MYIDWVIALSVVILVLTCVFLGYGLYYAVKKVHQADDQVESDMVNGHIESSDTSGVHLAEKRA